MGLELAAGTRVGRAGLLALLLASAGPFGPGSATPGRAQSWGWEGAAVRPAPLDGGCGAGWMGRGPSDRRFIVMMVPHHEGAIAMADLALSRARRPEIRSLAQRIRESQALENDQMRRWYREWYGQALPVPATGLEDQPRGVMGMGMGMGIERFGASGLDALAPGQDFERAFLERMIRHHQMGVMMAAMALGSGQHPELRRLQESMVRVQSQEIGQMAQWYRSWYSKRS